jgi:hypothetical protein
VNPQNNQMNLFGKAKTTKASPKDAIVRLRETLEMLEKREKYLETKITNELKFAKANAQKNRRGKTLFLGLKPGSGSHGFEAEKGV